MNYVKRTKADKEIRPIYRNSLEAAQAALASYSEIYHGNGQKWPTRQLKRAYERAWRKAEDMQAKLVSA